MRLLVLDGNSIINRAFFGIRPLTTKDGTFTQAVVGFFNMMERFKEQTKPDGIVACFDVHAPTFRHKLYEGYKAGRHATPEELLSQMPLVKDILKLLGCTVLEMEGYEADDLLGTLARLSTEQNSECFLATGDRDSLQLVRDNVTVLLATTKNGRPETIPHTPDVIREKYNMEPSQLIDLKALMGDTSDKIPGVRGVGDKTGIDLIAQFGSLDNLYANVETAEMRETLRKKLIEDKELAYLSKTLGTIYCEVPIETNLESYRQKPIQKTELAKYLARLEMFKFIDRWGLNSVDVTDMPPISSETYSILEDAESVYTSVKETGHLDFITENNTVYVSLPDNRIVCLPSVSLLLPILKEKTIIRTHDSKVLYKLLMDQRIEPDVVSFDTKLAAYLLNPLASDYDLLRLAQEYSIPIPQLENETLQKAAAFPKIANRLEEEIRRENQESLLRDIELPLALVLADMECVGFMADAAGIEEYGKSLDTTITALQESVFEAVGYSFNLNSPKQLGKALFEDLGLPHGKKSKTGYSTNADVLNKLKNEFPVVENLLQYRTLAKLKSTYCDGLQKVIGTDGRIHSSFNQTETRTGRISSTEPNMQNIPVRSEVGRELRRFFKAPNGWKLCDADYSQIELRVLAALSKDPTMSKAFIDGVDVHRVTASQVFDIPEEMVTPLMRSQAKAVNFGIIYGIGAHSLSEDIGTTYAEAKHYIETYLAKYACVGQYMDDLITSAKEKGYGETLFGRRRPLPELRAANGMTRAFGERVARNMPIQGTAADIIKIAMIRVHKRLKEEKLQARLILQVHDELIVEAPESEAVYVTKILEEEMEQAVVLSVPFKVDAHMGNTWYDAKG